MVQSDGDIILLQSLDYETQQQYRIIVMAMVCTSQDVFKYGKCGVPLHSSGRFRE